MNNQLKISDFANLTGSSLKTVLYYHKIGLLPEPKRSAGGYRLYETSELTRMRLIKYLKSLGLDLTRIKTILGDINNHKTMREVLHSLSAELLSEQKNLAERVAKVESLLAEKTVLMDEETFVPSSFQMIAGIIGTEYMDEYARTCPEIFEQQRKLFGILDDFQWGEEHQETFRALALYFKDHPQLTQIALEKGARLSRFAELTEDDPEVEVLAQEAAELIKSMPGLANILGKQFRLKQPYDSLYNQLNAGVLYPAQMKYKLLLEQYLNMEHEDKIKAKGITQDRAGEFRRVDPTLGAGFITGGEGGVVMKNQLTISDFAKLTGSSLKTILYYHKIDLLPEPKRSPGGYRLYGALELTRMRQIKRLKSLGLDLKRIKAILGDVHNHRTLQEVLQSLKIELLTEKKQMEEQVARLDTLLSEETVLLDKDNMESSSFQITAEALGADNMKEFAQTCPKMFERQKNLVGILDDFQWGEEYQKTYLPLAEYFKTHPQQFQTSLAYASRISKLALMSEDDPEVELLARESAKFVKNLRTKAQLCKQSGFEKALENLHHVMVGSFMTPAQLKHWRLVEQYLSINQ